MKDNRKNMKKSIDDWWLTIDKFMNVQKMPKQVREHFYRNIEELGERFIDEIFRVEKKYEAYSKLDL